ncbi:hypothetical protein DMH88_12945 [Escherichia coli]|nr:hypothetical protein [Escherichia coli]
MTAPSRWLKFALIWKKSSANQPQQICFRAGLLILLRQYLLQQLVLLLHFSATIINKLNR